MRTIKNSIQSSLAFEPDKKAAKGIPSRVSRSALLTKARDAETRQSHLKQMSRRIIDAYAIAEGFDDHKFKLEVDWNFFVNSLWLNDQDELK